jgi:hypothetical protein
VVFSWIILFCNEENDEGVVFGGSGGVGFGDSIRVGASLGRVLLMASLRFGQSKEPSQLMAPVFGKGGLMLSKKSD